MRLRLSVFLVSLLVVTSCGRSETSQATIAVTPSPSPQAKPKLNACAMLTSQEVESIQGEAVRETKLNEGSADGLNVSQCFFTLPTFAKSISLAVTQRADGPGARDPRQFWTDTFHRDKEAQRDRDREREQGENEGEESRPPQKISGIGDEAFWMTSPAAGILYVLKGSSFVRLSIGGREDQETKIRKSKALAGKVIDRL